MPTRNVAVFSDDYSYLKEILQTLPRTDRLHMLGWSDVQDAIERKTEHVWMRLQHSFEMFSSSLRPSGFNTLPLSPRNESSPSPERSSRARR